MRGSGGFASRLGSFVVLFAACGGGSEQTPAGEAGANAGRAGQSSAFAGATAGASGRGGAGTSQSKDCGREPPKVDTLDLLLVIDDSGSMRLAQEALRAQIPHMLDVLASGDLEGDGRPDFAKLRNLHLGVVSSDMGLVGINDIQNCMGHGEDGILQNALGNNDDLLPPSDAVKAACGPEPYPPFLSYTPGVEVEETVELGFGCMAARGTEGCSFEQPLEAMLKALWPSIELDPATAVPVVPPRVMFLGERDGSNALGHGDKENAGFLRLDPRAGRSLLAVLMLTDEEDCSSSTTAHLTPSGYLQPGDPLIDQPLNLRCFKNNQNLYSVSRYVNGLGALRPGAEHLVVFGAIAGVPPELVDAAARAAIDFEDTAAREGHYQRILDAPLMQEREDTTLEAFQGGNLVPSCVFDTDPDTFGPRRAWPPRRIVEVARGMGSQGMIGSICQVDLRDPVDGFLATIARTLDGATDPGIPDVCNPALPGSAPAQPQAGAGPGPGAAPSGPRCAGVSESCFTQSMQFQCSDVEGCFWSTVTDSCTGSSRWCSEYHDQPSCARQAGCDWR